MINWEIIHNAYLADVHGQKFICLVVDKKYEPSRKKGKAFKIVAGISKELGFQELNISLGQLKIDERRLGEFILAMSKANKTKKEEMIKTLQDRTRS